MKEDYFISRGSVRNFSQKPISNELLEEIIEKASHAPTCGNMQLYSVIITRDNENKQKLAEYHFNQPAATTAPCILTICADFNRFERWCLLSDSKPGYRNFHSFIMALTDAVIFSQQIVTVAESMGLGTCYLGTVNYNAAEIAQFLNLPELVVPVASLSIGYPQSLPIASDRLPIKAIFHEERYRNDSDLEIKQFFAPKEEMDENKRFVEENQKNTLAQVFTDIRYPGNLNESVSESFTKLIKFKGF